MKKNAKKGFTIVELVIVIAVIAILASVLIPTFSNVVARANESSAQTTARNAMTNVLSMSADGTLSSGTRFYVMDSTTKTDKYAFVYEESKLVAAKDSSIKGVAENDLVTPIAAKDVKYIVVKNPNDSNLSEMVKGLITVEGSSALNLEKTTGEKNKTVMRVTVTGGGDNTKHYDIEIVSNSDIDKDVIVLVSGGTNAPIA